MADIRSSTRVSVRDLPVMADIGINPDEIGQLQPLVISVCLLVDAVVDDSLQSTIDYRYVVELAEALSRQRIGLIETFGTELARSCLAVSGVQHAEVVIDKPRALASGMASVTISMSRNVANDIRSGLHPHRLDLVALAPHQDICADCAPTR